MDCREVLANRPAADTEERTDLQGLASLHPPAAYCESSVTRCLYSHGSPPTVRGHHSPGRTGGSASCLLSSSGAAGNREDAAARERSPPGSSVRRSAPSPFVSTAEVMKVSSRYQRPQLPGYSIAFRLFPFPFIGSLMVDGKSPAVPCAARCGSSRPLPGGWRDTQSCSE